MADTGKRPIRAQEILSDIRGGMNRRQLKQKYGLSERSLDSVFRKLAEAGLLSPAEMRAASVSSPSRVDGLRKDTQAAALKNCPACDARLTSESSECPACGVVVAKFEARRAQQSSARVQVRESDSETGKKWLLVCGVLAIVAVAVGYFLFPRNQGESRGTLERRSFPPHVNEEESTA